MLNTLLFPILFLIFGTLILWIILGCKGWWHAKFWLINITAVFVFILWSSLDSYLGSPYLAGTPPQFRLAGFIPNEPKCLYVLGETENDNSFSFKQVFAYKSDDKIKYYRIPYDKKLHQELEQAMERVAKGQYVIVSKNKILESEELRQLTDENFTDVGGGVPSSEYYFYILPPSKIFKKPEN